MLTTVATQVETSALKAAPNSAKMKPGSRWGIRHLQAGLSLLGIVVTYALRSAISVVIVAMVDKKNANPDYPEYDWSEQIQSVVLSGHGWGYFILQVPGGLLAERFSPSIVITVSHVVAALASILTPVAATTGGWGLVFACRFVQGLAQGMIEPALMVILSRWLPAKEKGTLLTIIFAGWPLGSMLALSASGVLSTGAAGWPSTFYVFGGLDLCWTAMWMLLGSNSPAEDRFVSAEERAYIEDSLRTNEQGTTPRKTPWRAIMTSLPVWAITISYTGSNWGFTTLQIEMPTFFKTVLGYDLDSNGFLSALPFVALLAFSFVFNIASLYLTNNKIISVNFGRKLFNSMSCFPPAFALVALCFIRDKTTIIALLTIAIGFNSSGGLGYIVNYSDLAPNFAGTIYGVTNGIGEFVTCFAPLVVGALVTDTSSVAEWDEIFFIAAGAYFVAGIFYNVFASTELQAWNDPPIVYDSENGEIVLYSRPWSSDISSAEQSKSTACGYQNEAFEI